MKQTNADSSSNQRITEERLLAEIIRLREAMPDQFMNAEVMRSFAISGFGIWNCDHPQIDANEIPISATFRDGSGNTVKFAAVAVLFKGFNGITQYYESPIRIIPGKPNMLWAIHKEQFYYLSYSDFAALPIDVNSTAFTFTMKQAANKITSYEDIRKLVGTL